MNRARLIELLLRNVTLLIFVALFLYFGLQAPRFLGLDSIANIVKQASFIGIIAVGMTFVLLTAGIDLSVGSNMYLSAMSAAYLMQVPALQNGWGVVLAILAGLLTGTVFGAMHRHWHEVPTLIVSLGFPYYLYDAPRAPTYVNAYGSSDAIQAAVVEALLGRAPFEGTNPVDPFCGMEQAKY